MKSVKDSWEKFLHPGTLRANLLLISLFIAAFEMFKDSVIQKPESFFCDGFNKDGLIISETYRNEVLSKSKSRLHASLLWFQEMGAIDDADLRPLITSGSTATKSHTNCRISWRMPIAISISPSSGVD
jgi:hypothetical protein